MIKMSCPYCEQLRDVEEIHKNEFYEKKGIKFTYEAIHYECKTCGQIFDTSEQMEANLGAMREAYQKEYDTFTPSEIREIREKYNASQKAFGLILGMGELTINCYEQGKSIPNSTNRLLLQLASEPFCFFKMYKQNKFKIGKTQRDRIESSEVFNKWTTWEGVEGVYLNLDISERTTLENRTEISNEYVVSKTVTDIIKNELNHPSVELYKDSEDVSSTKNDFDLPA